MSQPIENPANRQSVPLTSAVVTDRGLNEKRPLNEDSFLADSERGIFSVADGVGGAEAGEVASQTAIEVLDEAFRHQTEGADIEDLMELAIQRANASIHQMAQDHPKFASMATTIVGLHINGNVATIGHVGDSRLYRLTPGGQLLRETADHSVVEEEVRAGRMTAEQAANHPSKNVISRALGAENGVEVDMKVIEVEDGTEFLLCTDGITRHIPDHELRQLLMANDDLAAVCAELKQRCYERGAEDNLTAILVCVGQPISASERDEELDKTISPETAAVSAVGNDAGISESVVGTRPDESATLLPPSRKAFPASGSASPLPDSSQHSNAIENKINIGERAAAKAGSGGRTAMRLFLFLIFVAAVAAAFYGGRKYKGRIPYLDQSDPSMSELSPAASPAPVVGDDPILRFERSRREIDNDPNAWLATQLKNELARQGIEKPLDSTDGEFLYLYGRASLLVGDNDEAAKAFEAAITRVNLVSPQENATLKKEATLGLAAVALKADKDRPAAQAHLDEITRNSSQPAASGFPASSPANSPPGSPLHSP